MKDLTEFETPRSSHKKAKSTSHRQHTDKSSGRQENVPPQSKQLGLSFLRINVKNIITGSRIVRIINKILYPTLGVCKVIVGKLGLSVCDPKK